MTAETMQGWTPEEVYAIEELAYVLHAEGQNRSAAIVLEGLLTIDPAKMYCRDALCAVYLSLNQPHDVVRHASILLDAHPSHHNAMVRRCEANLQLKRLEEAERDLEALRNTRAQPHARRLELRLRVERANRIGG